MTMNDTMKFCLPVLGGVIMGSVIGNMAIGLLLGFGVAGWLLRDKLRKS